MDAKKTIVEAYMEFLSLEFNTVVAEVDNGYIVVKRSCSVCHFYKTDKTKHCGSPLSTGCWAFIFNKDRRIFSNRLNDIEDIAFSNNKS